jgi:hypothetical protein
MAVRLAALPLDTEGWDRAAQLAPGLFADAAARWWARETAPAPSATLAGVPARTPMVGGRGGSPFDDAPPSDTRVVGLRVSTTKVGGRRVLASLQALFDGGAAAPEGKVFGRAAGTPSAVQAPDGFALGALYVRGGSRVDGFRPVWLGRRADGSLDATRVSIGPWVGGHGGAAPTRLGSGLPIVGVCGRAGLELDAIGLVEQVPAK